MSRLRERFGLDPEDLNLDLGPLGPLLPRSTDHECAVLDSLPVCSAGLLLPLVRCSSC